LCAPSYQAAVELFENQPHVTIFPCDGVHVMPLVGSSSADWCGDPASAAAPAGAPAGLATM